MIEKHVTYLLFRLCILYFCQVDKHIRKLDADLARFEADLKDKSSAAKLKADSDSGKKSKCAMKLDSDLSKKVCIVHHITANFGL